LNEVEDGLDFCGLRTKAVTPSSCCGCSVFLTENLESWVLVFVAENLVICHTQGSSGQEFCTGGIICANDYRCVVVAVVLIDKTATATSLSLSL